MNWSALTSSPQDSPASPTVTPASAKVKTILGGFGLKSSESFAWYDLDSSSWKTYQGCLVSTTGEPWEKFSGTWPRSGIVLNGKAYLLPPLVRRIRGKGSGLWPTPTAMNPNETEDLEHWEARRALMKERHHNGNGFGTPLGVAVRQWPTPQARDYRSPDSPNSPRQERKQRQGWSLNLNEAAYFATFDQWPTPQAHDATGARGKNNTFSDHHHYPHDLVTAVTRWPTPTVGDSKNARNSTATRHRIPPTGIHKGDTLTDAITLEGGDWPTPTASRRSGLQTHGDNAILGSLNPDWVECLMGVPIGWTDPDCDEADQPEGWRSGALHRWPAGRGAEQYEWEPPRIAQGVKHRRQRIASLGDGQVPQVAEMIGLALREWLESTP